MNCRLHNSLSALLASGAMLAVVLAVAAPAGFAARPGGASAATPGARAAIGTVAHASPLPDPDRNLKLEVRDVREVRPAPRASRSGARHRRHIVVMPFFSFTPRG